MDLWPKHREGRGGAGKEEEGHILRKNAHRWASSPVWQGLFYICLTSVNISNKSPVRLTRFLYGGLIGI